MPEQVRIKLLRAGAGPPGRATEGSAGYDVRACLDAPEALLPGQTKIIPAGFAIELPPGFAAFIYARSGLGINRGVVPANCVGVIDSDYRGEVAVGLTNHSGMAYTIEPGERVAQMVIAACATPELVVSDSLDDTARGAGGFGSSGR